jgi:hypothetical protein
MVDNIRIEKQSTSNLIGKMAAVHRYRTFNFTADDPISNGLKNQAMALKLVKMECNVDLAKTICGVLIDVEDKVVACMFYRDLYEVIILEVICVQEPHRQKLGTQLISNLFKVSIDQKTDIHLYAVPASVPFYLALDFKHSPILKNCDPMCKSKYLTTEHMVREYPGKPTPINTRSRALLETNEVVTCSSASTCASTIERNIDTCSSACDCASSAFVIADILLDTSIFELDVSKGIIDLANLSKSLQSIRKRKVDVIACALDIDAQLKVFIIAQEKLKEKLKEKLSAICDKCTEAEEMIKETSRNLLEETLK